MKPKRMTVYRKRILLSISVLTLSSLVGCIHPRLNNSRRLMERSDFTNAVVAAPEWCRDALKTINRLEKDIESGKRE
jgi:hypothetical protein